MDAPEDSASRLVVIGHGPAGHRLVEALSERDTADAWHITVIGEEGRPAYDRVALTSYPTEVTLLTGDRVVPIDRTGRTVRTRSGTSARYDALVLAAGSVPFAPPAPGRDLPGAFVHRTIEWRDILDDPVELRGFVSFVNAPDTPDPSIAFAGTRPDQAGPGGRSQAGGDAPVTAQADTSTRWDEVCAYDDLMPERGACALVRDIQVAVSRTFDGELYALSNHDPFSGAYVPPRGILGTRQGVPTVASPMYKQVFRPAYRTIPGRFRSGDARLRRPRVPWRGRRPGEGGRTLTCFLIPGRGARPVPAVPVAGAAVRGSRGRPAPCLPARSSGRPRTSATERARGCRP